jgi:hypothetical protein
MVHGGPRSDTGMGSGRGIPYRRTSLFWQLTLYGMYSDGPQKLNSFHRSGIEHPDFGYLST